MSQCRETLLQNLRVSGKVFSENSERAELLLEGFEGPFRESAALRIIDFFGFVFTFFFTKTVAQFANFTMTVSYASVKKVLGFRDEDTSAKNGYRKKTTNRNP